VCTELGWVLGYDMLSCYVGQGVQWVGFTDLLIDQLSPVIVELVCKMTQNSSFSFPYCMFLVKPWSVSDFHIHVCC